MTEYICDVCRKKMERGDPTRNYFGKDIELSNGIRIHVLCSFFNGSDSMYPLDFCTECGKKLLKESGLEVLNK